MKWILNKVISWALQSKHTKQVREEEHEEYVGDWHD